jgi:hypothetical protein
MENKEKEIKETDCYKATYYYPPNSYVEIELFSKSSGCMFSSGYMKISRIGTVGNKITVIQIGKIENDQWTPVVMGNMNIYGYVNAERQVNGDIKLATGDVAGDVFTSFGSTEACNKSSKTCLTITQKVDQNDMVAKYGLNGTMKVEAKLTEAKVIINMDLTGSLWTETQNMETGEVEGVNQTIIAGQYAEKTCNTNATPATFTFTIPFSLKIDCYCPKPGSLSGKGDIWTDVQIDCTKDGNPDALMRISYKNTTEYIAFLSSCGVSTTDTKLCLGEGYVSYKDQDLSKCGLSGVLCTLGKDYFKCNSTCTQCTNTILLETLSETLQDWAKKASQVNTSKLADLEKKLTGQESSIIEDYIKMAQELCTVPQS